MLFQYASAASACGSSVPMPTIATFDGAATSDASSRRIVQLAIKAAAPSLTSRCRSSIGRAASRSVATWPIMYMPSLNC